MRQAFQGFLALFGVIVIAISLAHMAIGPRAIIGSVAVNPTMAGEDRFFAGLLLCFGIALLWRSRDVQRKRGTSICWPRRSSSEGSGGPQLRVGPTRGRARRPASSVLRRDARARAAAAAADGRRSQAGRRAG
jgi:Domain of unknown function (DUF4345)